MCHGMILKERKYMFHIMVLNDRPIYEILNICVLVNVNTQMKKVF